MDSEKVTKELRYADAFRSARNIVNKEGYNIIFMALHGSQNYNLSTEESDFDWYVAVEPTFEDFVFNRGSISREIQYLYGIITIKDVRDMFQMIKKGGFNFLEILFTDYYYVNKKYEDEWNILRAEAEKIARNNEYSTIRSYIGLAGNLVNKEAESKSCYRILVCANQITSYINGDSFKKVMISDCIYDHDFVMKIKTKANSKGYLQILSNNAFNYIHTCGTKYFRGKTSSEMIDNATREELDKILISICKKKNW